MVLNRLQMVVVTAVVCFAMLSVSCFVSFRQAEAVVNPLLVEFGIYVIQVLMAGAAVGAAATVGQYAIPALVDKVSASIQSMSDKTKAAFQSAALLWQAGKNTFGLRELKDAGAGHLAADVLQSYDEYVDNIEGEYYSLITETGHVIQFELDSVDTGLIYNRLSSVFRVDVGGKNVVGWEIKYKYSVPAYLDTSDKITYKYTSNAGVGFYGGFLSSYSFSVMNRVTGQILTIPFSTYYGTKVRENGDVLRMKRLSWNWDWVAKFLESPEGLDSYYSNTYWSSVVNNGLYSQLVNIGLPISLDSLLSLSNTDWEYYGAVNFVSNYSLLAEGVGHISLPGTITIPSVSDEPPVGVVPVIPPWWQTLNPDATFDQSLPIARDAAGEIPGNPDVPIEIPGDGTIDFSPLLQSFDAVTTVFPFSIPWDLQRIMQSFVGVPVRPSLTWQVPVINQQVVISLPDWADEVALWLRRLELIAFNFGLILWARTLAKPEGGSQ
mgnify:CR=1 FL=1